ncbi:O-acetyltransferase-like protein [Perkinsela sp. CCAP 1560/4]|nr:O-acetyltransferase-like protein [Perkinsela sp. CCAP 1560/4]|eukprot:KNH04225.1 O-acetyltransferase-like protein [Perkinsela sp. CCAP 1560/4]
MSLDGTMRMTLSMRKRRRIGTRPLSTLHCITRSILNGSLIRCAQASTTSSSQPMETPPMKKTFSSNRTCAPLSKRFCGSVSRWPRKCRIGCTPLNRNHTHQHPIHGCFLFKDSIVWRMFIIFGIFCYKSVMPLPAEDQWSPPHDHPENQKPQAETDLNPAIERTQREIRRLNQESWAIIDALRAQRTSLDKTDTLQEFLALIRKSTKLIGDSEKGNFRNRAMVYCGVCIWILTIVYLLWRRL